MKASDHEGGHFILPADIDDFRRSIDHWRAEGLDAKRDGDEELTDTYRQDVKELEHILGLVIASDYEAARDAIYDLDTLVRDQIPTTLYEKLTQ